MSPESSNGNRMDTVDATCLKATLIMHGKGTREKQIGQYVLQIPEESQSMTSSVKILLP